MAVRWWPVDKLILSYLAAAGLLLAFYWRQVPGAGWLLLLHGAGALLIFAAARHDCTCRYSVFRHWYPLPYVAACYKEMGLIIPAIRKSSFDLALDRFDMAIWGTHPTVWLERFPSAGLAEFLQIVYSTFVPAVLLIAALLWRKRRLAEFRYYAFLISLGFLVSYVGYLFVPARGPRFVLNSLQHLPLRGLALLEPLRGTLDRLESAHYDCFPSGHTEMTFLACWSSRQISANLFRLFLVYTLCVVFATVYLRYHYTVDVVAGAAVALLLLIAAPGLYERMGR